ncbi:RHS repeat domain-containing protein [Chryseobacterium sp.]|uniref:RHS repeat domain-containing protein n=1 Tax=Chryseobacterium sp. TaxID=1871047 RepID=UPI002FC61E4D
MSFARNSAGAFEITDANDYYPFGMNHLKTGNAFFGVGSYKNYKYNGKELQETGMYDYGARMYMADLGRWSVIDELAENFNKYSPYNYVKNTPINGIDPDGRDVIILNDRMAVGGIEGIGEGFGHAAVIIGNEKDGWYYYSMNGTSVGDGPGRMFGNSKVPNIGTPLGKELTPAQAMALANTINKDKQHNYDRYKVIKTTKEEDEKMKKAATEAASMPKYNLFKQSCQTVVSNTYNALLSSRTNSTPQSMNYNPNHTMIPNMFFENLNFYNFMNNIYLPKKEEIKTRGTLVVGPVIDEKGNELD